MYLRIELKFIVGTHSVVPILREGLTKNFTKQNYHARCI